MMRPLLYISSFLLMWQTFAQADSVAVDSLEEESVRFIQPSFSFDYGKALVSAAGFEQKYEGAFSLLFFDNYYLTGEIGTGNLQPKNGIQNGKYQSEGNYYRIGGGYLKAINSTSKLGLGVRYAMSTFNDLGEYYVESRSGSQDDYSEQFERKNLEARWVEMVLTSESKVRLKKSDPEARINQLFSLGFHLRLRVISSYDRFSPIDVYSVPGYGRTVNNPNLALNLFLKFTPF